ncbi:MAG TPA: tRNA lysidine(34) synthetase TilS, partial [Polyangia bacterium]|nr:tRNA lysidine(34) synthetase TilS [Polyangia bacterium]
FIRPLLDIPRATIEAYVRRRSLPVVTDPSNADGRFARARLRHQLLPILRRENPRLAEALLALAADARRLTAPGGSSSPAAAPAELGYVGRAAAAAVAELRRRGGTGFVDVRGGKVKVAYGHTTRLPPGAPAPLASAGLRPNVAVSIDQDGMFSLDGAAGVEIRTVASAAAPFAGAVAAFDADELREPLVLRARRPGDRMRPRGGRGSRKVSDLLIDAKVARDRRPSLPVLAAADGTILFVPGLRPSEAARPTDGTRRWRFVRPFDRVETTSV